MRMIESEKLLEKKLVSAVKSIGGWCLKIPATHLTGIPDRMCLIPKGRVVFVEVKTTKASPRKIQILIHQKLRALGFEVRVVDTSALIDTLIKDYA